MISRELLRSGGVEPAGLTLVHCGLELSEEETAALLRELREFCAPGVLVMPAGESPECRIALFDPETTPSRQGALSELFRKEREVVRSLHPAGSLAAAGPGAAALLAGHEKCISGFSPASPWWRIFQQGGKLVFMGCGLEACGLFAAVEEWAGAASLSRRLYRCRLLEKGGGGRVLRIRRHNGAHFRNYPKVEEELFLHGILIRVPWEHGRILIADIRRCAEFLLFKLRRNRRLFASRRRKKA